jgi:hypothetical protein
MMIIIVVFVVVMIMKRQRLVLAIDKGKTCHIIGERENFSLMDLDCWVQQSTQIHFGKFLIIFQ